MRGSRWAGAKEEEGRVRTPWWALAVQWDRCQSRSLQVDEPAPLGASRALHGWSEAIKAR